MNHLFSWLGKKFISAAVSAIFFVFTLLGIAYALIEWPTTPEGEYPGGNIMKLFDVCWPNEVLQGFDFSTGKKCASMPSGTPGISIASATVNAWGHLIITKTDGTQTDAGYVMGATGPQGPAGSLSAGRIKSVPYSGGCSGGQIGGYSGNRYFEDNNGNNIPDSGETQWVIASGNCSGRK